MKTLTVIMVHGDKYAEDAFYRHFNEWTKHEHNILLFTPGNKSLNSPLPQLSFGQASHHDNHAIERFIFSPSVPGHDGLRAVCHLRV